MIIDAEGNRPGNAEAELRAALMQRCQLSATAVERINETMQASGLSFCESALRLEFVTQDDIDTSVSLLKDAPEEAKHGLVEEAIRMLSSQRQVILRPRETVKPGPHLELARDSYNQRSETIRSLRTELLLRGDSDGSIALCVISPSGQEGRSQLAAELAISFAQLERRTLLVDADMRRPSQHMLFQAGNERGLGDALTRGGRPHIYGVEGLPSMSLITSGTIPANPLELLSSTQFAGLIAEWRNTNEFVIIDTPAVTSYADALAIATKTGRALLVTRASRTSFANMRELVRRVTSTRASIIGATLNHF